MSGALSPLPVSSVQSTAFSPTITPLTPIPGTHFATFSPATTTVTFSPATARSSAAFLSLESQGDNKVFVDRGGGHSLDAIGQRVQQIRLDEYRTYSTVPKGCYLFLLPILGIGWIPYIFVWIRNASCREQAESVLEDKEPSLATLTQAIKAAHPSKKWVYQMLRGQANLKIGLFQQAIRDFNVALHQLPSPKLLCLRAFTQCQLGCRYKQAVNDCNLALRKIKKSTQDDRDLILLIEDIRTFIFSRLLMKHSLDVNVCKREMLDTAIEELEILLNASHDDMNEGSVLYCRLQNHYLARAELQYNAEPYQYLYADAEARNRVANWLVKWENCVEKNPQKTVRDLLLLAKCDYTDGRFTRVIDLVEHLEWGMTRHATNSLPWHYRVLDSFPEPLFGGNLTKSRARVEEAFKLAKSANDHIALIEFFIHELNWYNIYKEYLPHQQMHSSTRRTQKLYVEERLRVTRIALLYWAKKTMDIDTIDFIQERALGDLFLEAVKLDEDEENQKYYIGIGSTCLESAYKQGSKLAALSLGNFYEKHNQLDLAIEWYECANTGPGRVGEASQRLSSAYYNKASRLSGEARKRFLILARDCGNPIDIPQRRKGIFEILETPILSEEPV